MGELLDGVEGGVMWRKSCFIEWVLVFGEGDL